jgi:hypothetical protein
MARGCLPGYHASTVNRDVTTSDQEPASRSGSIIHPMNTNRSTRIFAAVVGLTAFSTAGCTEKPTPGDGSSSAIKAKVTERPAAGAATEPSSSPADATAPAVVAGNVQWTDIKHHPFDRREVVMAGLTSLEAKVAEQVKALQAKRAGMKASTDTQRWDLAMKEMMDAQAYLTAMVLELGKSTREFWDQNKDKVGRAWDRTQDAYGKVKASTTS